MAKKKSAKKTTRNTRSQSGRSNSTKKKSATKSKPVSRKAPSKKKTVSKSTSRKKSATKTTSSRRSGSKSRMKTPASIEAELKKIDREILSSVNQRSKLYTQLLNLSDNPREAIFDPQAEDKLWLDLEKLNKGPLPMVAVRGIYREILSCSRRNVKTQRVAYLGPPHSFSYQAAMERFGPWAELISVSSIAAVFEEVNRGNADYGLVPIENSTDGRVIDTLDMFTRLPIRICGEVLLSIHHNLLGRCARNEITEIYSKPQALSQCRDWLAINMPQARLIDVSSTSTAAQLARDKLGVGAVASYQAAVQYELQILAENIEDNLHNVTRFAIIGDEESKATGLDRTAILLQIPHKPGALSDALTGFKKNKVNLTWIESFPLRGEESGYLFFLDFEGHQSEAKVKRTLKSLETYAVRLDILGSYPRSDTLKD